MEYYTEKFPYVNEKNPGRRFRRPGKGELLNVTIVEDVAALRAAGADAVLIGAIMPLVPGATLTTGIRDTINGDYSAGTARIAEAVVTALAVATGVAASMMVLR